MSKIALAFFTIAPLYGLIGMAWGIQMGASGDHTLFPAHAHLNLLGLVVNGLMGAFYALAGERISKRLAWINFGLWNFGILWMIPVLTVILSGNTAIAPIITVGEVAAVLGMLVFLINVARLWKAPASA